MPVTLGLNHINLNVADVARAETFYREAFGLEVRFGEGDMLFLGTPRRARHHHFGEGGARCAHR